MSTTLRRPGRADQYEQVDDVRTAGSRSDPRYQAFMLMRAGYTVLPLVMGIDKFFNSLTNWP